MSQVISTKVTIDEKSIRDKIEILLDDKTMLAVHNLFAKMNDPYVPFLEGPLSQTVVVTPRYLDYIQPYAHYQYNGVNFNFTKDYHPLATHHWDEAMMRNNGESFKRQVQAILKRRAKEIYGD